MGDTSCIFDQLEAYSRCRLKAADAPVACHALGTREAYFRLIAPHRVGKGQGEAEGEKKGAVLSHRPGFMHGFAPAGRAA